MRKGGRGKEEKGREENDGEMLVGKILEGRKYEKSDEGERVKME